MVVLLVMTLGSIAWLGYEAVTAAASHRRTAEAVLRDYALLAATEFAQDARNGFDDVVDEILTPMMQRNRARGSPSPFTYMMRELRDVTDHSGCPCPSFSEPLYLFRVDRDGTVTTQPEATRAVRERIARLTAAPPPPRDRIFRNGRSGIVTSAAGDLAARPTAIGFLLSEDDDGNQEPTYGFVLPGEALTELIRHYYETRRLLPEVIAGDVPSDSILQMTIEAPDGRQVFSSAVPYANAPGVTVPLPDGPRFGGLVLHASIRPDAASELVIGGLPNSRLPLLGVMLVLTLGVGAASLFQLRREQGFQRLREDFISSVSHELRTPLAQIRIFSELQEGGKLATDEERERATFVIAREARRLSHLVDNILQFSSLRRSWRHAVPLSSLDLGEAIADGIDSVTPLLEMGEMRLALDVGDGVRVRANGEALTRIVVNLLDNAIKYGPRGQTIRVIVRRDGETVRLTVQDEGPGVPAQDRSTVWKPYRRLERDVRAQVPGSGIGLAVVSELVAHHGGRVWVERAERGGGSFTVELPAEGVEPTQEHALEEAAAAPAGTPA